MNETINARDPLYHSLDLILKLKGVSKTAQEILAGLPIEDHRVPIKTFVRAVNRVGIRAQIKKIPLKKIVTRSLPAILLLREDKAVYAMRYSAKGESLHVISTDGSESESSLQLNDIAPHYLGYAIAIRSEDNNEIEQGDETTGKSHKWFWSVFFKSWRFYRDVLLASFLINVFALASPLFIMNVYDRVVPNYALETLWVLVIGVLIIFFFDLILRILRGYFIDIAGRRVDVDLSAMLYQHVLGIRMAARPPSVGAFANHLDEFESIRNFITSATVTTLIDLPFVVLFLLVIWFVGDSLVFVPLIAIPLILFYALIMQPVIKGAVQRVMQGSAQKSATLVESLVGIETIKLLNAESRQQHKWEQAIEYISKWSVRSRLFSTSVVNAAVFLQQMTTIGVVAYGVYLIAEGSLSLGGLIAAVILTSRVLAPMAQVANLTTHYHQVVAALKTISSILALPIERVEKKEYLSKPTIAGNIEFDSVSFAYPEQSDMALNNVTLKITAGEHVAVIGRTGSGKSTLGKLIAGLYQENSGFVRVDGLDVRHIDPTVLRCNIGYVPQEVMLFSGTMRDNILFGSSPIPDEQLLVAAEISGVMTIVKKHPAGFDLHIGERGMGLSGGQRQAVAVARAVLHDAPVIIMDEPTTSIDSGTELRLKEKLKEYLQGKTFILITHKSSMLDLVDRLIVLDEGRVIADGKKEEVIKALQSTQ